MLKVIFYLDTTIPNFGVSKNFLLKEINTFTQKGCRKSIKSDRKDFHNVTNDF